MAQEGLSPRERQIWALLAQGKANKEIAYRLGLSLGTVKTYTHRLYSKLGVSCRVEAVLRYIEHHRWPYKREKHGERSLPK